MRTYFVLINFRFKIYNIVWSVVSIRPLTVCIDCPFKSLHCVFLFFFDSFPQLISNHSSFFFLARWIKSEQGRKRVTQHFRFVILNTHHNSVNRFNNNTKEKTDIPILTGNNTSFCVEEQGNLNLQIVL